MSDGAIATLQNVSYSVDGDTLLSDINLELPQSGLTAIMGHNGAGKSTLLRLLANLLVPTHGAITWHPQPTKAEPERAFVFQRPVMLRRSVSANVAHAISNLKLSAREATARIEDSLNACNLTDLRNHSARRLSGGEQQRLAMARALARRPDLLLLDEPTASLDPAATKAVEDIARLASATGTKVVIVTHDAAQAQRLASDVVFLYSGQAVEHSATNEFFNNPVSQPARDYLAGRITVKDN